MRIRTLALLASLAAFAGSAAAAHLADDPGPGKQRQAGMIKSRKLLDRVKKAADSGDVKSEAAAADELAAWAKTLPTLFPAGSQSGDARSNIWTDPTGFAQKAESFDDATAKLAELVNAGDSAGAATQVSEVKQACGTCHAGYKKS